MNLEELKSNWKKLDEKMDRSQQLNEKVILSMLKDQSKSTVSKIQNQLKTIAIYFSCLFILLVAILAGNPFDYENWYEYIPSFTYTLLLIKSLEIVIREISAVNKITLSRDNLRESLGKIIILHENYKAVMDRVWKMSMIIGFLMGISLMIRNFENYGPTKSLLLIIGNAATVMLIFFLARNTFKRIPDRNLEELKMNLAELDE